MQRLLKRSAGGASGASAQHANLKRLYVHNCTV